MKKQLSELSSLHCIEKGDCIRCFSKDIFDIKTFKNVAHELSLDDYVIIRRTDGTDRKILVSDFIRSSIELSLNYKITRRCSL